MKRHYVLKNKGRFISIIIFVIILSCSILFATSVYGDEIRQYDTVIVQRGDTLWSIAKEYKKDSEDIRDLIAEIRKINNLKTSMIYAGDELLVPCVE